VSSCVILVRSLVSIGQWRLKEPRSCTENIVGLKKKQALVAVASRRQSRLQSAGRWGGALMVVGQC
jgi:hypothetical protein